MQGDMCDVPMLHEEVVHATRQGMLNMSQRESLAEFFKTLGDPTRMGILWALSLNEMCVCDLAALLCMGQSAVSHQLRTLRQARLVKSRREGKVVYYTLSDEHPGHIIQLGLVHLEEPD